MASPIRFAKASALLLVLPACISCPGCRNATYTGADPSARSFHEDPEVRQYYLGFDLNFALDDPAPHVPGLAGQ